MKTISADLPDDIEDDLDTYANAKMLDRSSAVQKLLAEGLARWQREKAIVRLRDGEVTFARAAEIAGTNTWDFADMLAERDVTWISESRLQADLDAIPETQ